MKRCTWAALWLAFAATNSLQAAEDLAAARKLLLQHDVKSDVDSLIVFLDELQPDPLHREKIEQLVNQLSDDSFRVRESAAKEIAAIGDAARPYLMQATRRYDTEVQWRARRLLGRLEDPTRQELREALVEAAFKVLKHEGAPRAAPTLLSTIALLEQDHLRDFAFEALWRSVRDEHRDVLETAIASDNRFTRAAAIVGLEIAAHEAAVLQLTKFLLDEDGVVRLSAARAFIDDKTEESVRALIALLGSTEHGVAWKARDLLLKATGDAGPVAAESAAQREWLAWADAQLASAKLDVPLGEQRYDLTSRRSIIETFSAATKEIKSNYGRFRYEATVAGKAAVLDGRLRFDGQRPGDGEQKLVLTAQRAIGSDNFPRRFQVRTKLGGQALGSGAWHIGVSLGRVRILFHPGYSGGGFRAEMIATRREMFANQSMGFTPAGDVLHDMTIQVETKDGKTKFDVTIVNGADKTGKQRFTKSFSLSNSKAGNLDRIALERSGRTGGAAFFDSLEVQLR